MKFLNKVLKYYILALNEQSGPAGPLDILKARDKEIEFKNGIPSLKHTDVPNPPKKIDDFHKGKGGPFESDQGSYPFILPDLLSAPDRGWPQTGHNAPDRRFPKEEDLFPKKTESKVEPQDPKKQETDVKDKVEIKVQQPKDVKVEPEVKIEPIKKPKFFTELIAVVRSLYPQIKMAFPQPPTYIWNPVLKEGEELKDKPLDTKAIKNRLKLKFPDLVWSTEYGSIDTATYMFPDNSKAEFALGQDANHLTVTFSKN